jgi:hypothetical protein
MDRIDGKFDRNLPKGNGDFTVPILDPLPESFVFPTLRIRGAQTDEEQQCENNNHLRKAFHLMHLEASSATRLPQRRPIRLPPTKP